MGDRQGDLENTFTLPSYVRTDAAIYYRRDNWRVRLNIKNRTYARVMEERTTPDTEKPVRPCG
ncbi:hypothetical protein [Nostoc sp.]|uniref:hypothetical protein n=1 Tax=Nostoc sp. TaxID=1180 RepID=UPI003FA5AE61